MLVWEDTRDVRFDDTCNFGLGYDFDPWEHFRWEADTPMGRMAIWPEWGEEWSVYGGELGWYIQSVGDERVAKLTVERMARDHMEARK